MEQNPIVTAPRVLEITHNIDEVLSDLDQLSNLLQQARDLIKKIESS